MAGGKNPPTTRCSQTEAAVGDTLRRSTERFRRLKHSCLDPLPKTLKNPYWNKSRCEKPSLTPSTTWRKMTAGFLTCLLSLGFLCVSLVALWASLKLLWRDDETRLWPASKNSSSKTPS